MPMFAHCVYSDGMSQPTDAALVFLDPNYPAGRIADPAQPQILVTDEGLTRGDGVFETMLAVDGKVRKLELHLNRLASSANICTLPIPPEQAWEAAIQTAVQTLAEQRPDFTEMTVKLTATRGVSGVGSTCWVLATGVPESTIRQRENGVDVILLDKGHDAAANHRAPWLLMGAKTLSYAVNMSALRYAKAQGKDDVIFHTSEGRVLEGPTSTVLMAKLDPDAGVPTLITPRLETGVLPGTTQGAIFTGAEDSGWQLGYGPVTTEQLLQMDAVWLVSSVRLITPVLSLDDQPMGQHPEITAKLTEFLLAGAH